MVFSNTIFLFIFLPIVLILYYLANDKYKNYILLAASIFFYWYGEKKFVYLMLFSIFINYVVALLISKGYKEKLLLILDIIFNLGILFVFKYLNFSVTVFNYFFHGSIYLEKIILPIGISFFTFQSLSYVIDVYRDHSVVEKNFFNVALYISLFPQLIAGPIVRYSSVSKQIRKRVHSMNKFNDGTKRFMIGFIKKVLISNNVSVVASAIFGMDYKSVAIPLLWLGAICFSLQIYFDFSGYSDMAIGLGKMFGFEFDENFNFPYLARSITDFWRRWHISLSQWFRDYVYIPLGGSRCSKLRNLFNLFVVWCCTGLWHGANYTFILWGLIYFILLVFEKYFIKPDKRIGFIKNLIWPIVTLLCVNFLWVIFNAESLSLGIKYCLGMIGYFNNSFNINNIFIRYIRDYGFFIVLGIILSTSIGTIIMNKKFDNKTLFKLKESIVFLVLVFCFIWSISYLILGSHNPFIYFNF